MDTPVFHQRPSAFQSLLAISFPLLCVLSCKGGAEQWPMPKSAPATLPIVVHIGTKDVKVEAELALTSQEQSRGLMFRKQPMGDDNGMLFVYSKEGRHNFWMKNTYIPLDMLFIDSKSRIVGIVRNAEPHTTVSRSVDKPSQYVLEVDGGWCERHGANLGHIVSIPTVPSDH
jgi:uncharacterized membrane protein (UPF0127 family)